MALECHSMQIIFGFTDDFSGQLHGAAMKNIVLYMQLRHMKVN